MKIAIFGTRGIPNLYGGFEQFAQYLSEGLCKHGHDVYVYNSHDHNYQEKKWKEVNIIHCYNPEYKLGAVGQFFYDLNCILDSRKRDFDVILQLGYTSSSIWNWLFNSKIKLFTNMDGLEWSRAKYSKVVSMFLKFAENLAVKNSDVLISDNIGIQNYLQKKYKINSEYIPYGAHVFDNPDKNVLNEFQLIPFKYDLIIARIEPESNIKTIIDAFILSNVDRKLVVIGNLQTKLGKQIMTYVSDPRIIFTGFISSIDKLNNLRYYSNLYFHGHSVGGTNPSLIEAMASNSFICAHDNIFNSSILQDNAIYFSTKNQLISIIQSYLKSDNLKMCSNNLRKVQTIFNWDKIIYNYEKIMTKF